MQVYRFNKWWLMDNDFDFLSGLNGSFLGDIVSIVAVLIGLSVLILVTLLPTLMINSEVIVEGLVLKHFSEEFREEYGFTREDWYGK